MSLTALPTAEAHVFGWFRSEVTVSMPKDMVQQLHT